MSDWLDIIFGIAGGLIFILGYRRFYTNYIVTKPLPVKKHYGIYFKPNPVNDDKKSKIIHRKKNRKSKVHIWR